MPWGRQILAFLLAAASAAWNAPALAQATGHVQVEVPAGTEVVLDGRERVTTRLPEGALFRNVSPGPHSLTLHRADHVSQEALLWVEADAITLFRARAFQPEPPASTRGHGALIVDTLPVQATIDAKSLGWKKISKSDAPFVASRVPAGKHKLTFCTAYKCIDHRTSLRADEVKSLLVDFDPGVVEDVTRGFFASRSSDVSRCTTDSDLRACVRVCNLDRAVSPDIPSAACASLLGRSKPISQTEPGAPVRASSTIAPPSGDGKDQRR